MEQQPTSAPKVAVLVGPGSARVANITAVTAAARRFRPQQFDQVSTLQVGAASTKAA